MTVNYAPPLMSAKPVIACILQLEIHVFFVPLTAALSAMLLVVVHSVLLALPILMDFAILHALQTVPQQDAKIT